MRGSTIIATTFCMDSSGFESDYRYHAGHTKAAIYSLGDDYFAVGKNAPKDVVGQPWEMHPDQWFAEKHGTKLWRARMAVEEKPAPAPAAPAKKIRFTVSGFGAFPADMLCYDSCYAVTAEDVASIALDTSEMRAKDSRRLVHLETTKFSGPTEARWESFGWKIVDAAFFPSAIQTAGEYLDSRPAAPAPAPEQTQHTPGPWQHTRGDFLSICDSDGVKRGCAPIARIAGGYNAETRAEARANARLIVKAPEMRDLLREAADYLSCIPETAAGGDDDAGKLAKRIRDAIGEKP